MITINSPSCWLLLFLLCSSWGCSTRENESISVLIYGRGADADYLDPVVTSNGESAKVLYNIFDTLITFDEKTQELVPSLATQWEMSDDGLLYTFQLREGVTFHDGTPLDAEAVVFSFNRLYRKDDPFEFHNRTPYAPDFDMIKEVRAKDTHTVEFELKEPSAVFFSNLSMFAASIVSPQAVKKYEKKFSIHPVGTGPFKFDQWVPKQKIQLLANKKYWGGEPGVDVVIFKPSDVTSVLRTELERGDVHIVDNLPPSDLTGLESTQGITVQEQQGANVAYMTLNTSKPPMNNIKLRRAIAHAIDKQRLIKVCYDGQAQVAINPVPPNVPGWHKDVSVAAFDLDTARQFMDEFRAETNTQGTLELDLLVMQKQRPYMQKPAETAQFIKEALKPLGIEAKIKIQPNEDHFKSLSKGEHHLGLIGWSADTFEADNFLYTFFHPANIADQGGNNNSRYENAQVAKLLEDARREWKNKEKQSGLYEQVQEQVARDVPVVPLAHTSVRVAHRDELQGYYLHPSGKVRLRKAHFAEAGQ